MIYSNRFWLFHWDFILFGSFYRVLHLHWSLGLITNWLLFSHRFLYLYRSLFLNWNLWFDLNWLSFSYRDLSHRSLFGRNLFLFSHWFLKCLNLILLYPHTFFINSWWFHNRFIPFNWFLNSIDMIRLRSQLSMWFRLLLSILFNILINNLIILDWFLDSTFMVAFWFTVLSNWFLYRFRVKITFKDGICGDFGLLWGFFRRGNLRFRLFLHFLWFFCDLHLFFQVLLCFLHVFDTFAVHFLFFLQLVFNLFLFGILLSLIEFSSTEAAIGMTIIILKGLWKKWMIIIKVFLF